MAVTMDAYAPFDSGPGANVSEDGWRAMQRRTGAPGVTRDSLNGMQVYADGTGMQVKVKTGEVWAEGIYGAITTEKILPITSNSSGQPRKDLVVWRIDATNNRYEVDVIAGTPGSSPNEPAITRTSTVYEGPLAVVDVPSGDVSIDAAQVLDVRWYGGPTVPTLVDDFAMYGDKVASFPRTAMAGTDTGTDGTVFLTLTQAQRDTTATMIRYYLATARVGGFRDLRVYLGYSRHRLIDATGNINPSDTTGAGTVHSDGLASALSIKAGQFVGFAHLSVGPGMTTAPVYGRSAAVTSSEILNPSTTTLDPLGRWSTVFKGSQTSLPTVMQVHVDNNWTKRDRSFWYALA